MQDFRIGGRSSKNLIRVFLNAQDDYIVLNQNDASIFDKYTQILKWLDKKQAEYEKSTEAWKKKYKDRKIYEEKDGEIHIDSDQLSELSVIRIGLCRECCQRIDELFGEGTIKKYFREIYDEIPDFVPDEDCINDFFDEISPILGGIFDKRIDSLKRTYNKGRRGKHTKTKSELISEYKEKKVAEADE